MKLSRKHGLGQSKPGNRASAIVTAPMRQSTKLAAQIARTV
jgi:hypothetical protein